MNTFKKAPSLLVVAARFAHYKPSPRFSANPFCKSCSRTQSLSTWTEARPANSNSSRIATNATLIAIGTVALVAIKGRIVQAETPSEADKSRLIRLAEVQEHGRNAEKIWVIKGTRVYDITDWVPNHPGGEVILRAAGGSIDPYWKIFSIHQKQDVYDILEQYWIGIVDPRDLVDDQIPSEHVEDPFASDPERDPRLHVHSSRPCNAETPASELGAFITPNQVFYVRNHLWVPNMGKTEEYQLTVELHDGTEKKYTMQDLRERFRGHTITATLQCSGNRRAHMTANARSTNGLQWDVGAIGNAEWTGVRLRDVLADVGLTIDDVPEGVRHVQFSGAEAYGASISIAKAVDKFGDVLLAYKMNGEALPPDHGFPLRVLVPGHVAARSVKWLNKIALSDEESTSQWQRRDYKCFGPNEGSDPDWDSARSIQETPVQSAITSLRQVSAHSPQARKWMHVYGLEEDSVILEGYAFSGGGREIVRVDVSADDGRSWHQAELLDSDVKGSKEWSWKRWRFMIPNTQAGKVFVVKAVDEAYNAQPDSYEPHFNFRGNLTTGWQRMTVTCQPFRLEVARIVADYIVPGAPRELNLSHRDRSAVLHALQHATHPSAFDAVPSLVEATSRGHLHPHFVRCSTCTALSRASSSCGQRAGVTPIVLSLTIAILPTPSPPPRRHRTIKRLVTFIGTSAMIAAYKRLCVIRPASRSRTGAHQAL